MERVVITGQFLRFYGGEYQIVIGGYAGHGVYSNTMRTETGEIVHQEWYLQLWTPAGFRNIPCQDKQDAYSLSNELTILLDKNERERATRLVTEVSLGTEYYRETRNGS